MARHIHIHLVHDAAAHDPKNGQFTSGSGGGGASKPKKINPLYDKHNAPISRLS